MSKISVIIPVYNVEKYLDKCLESVVNQTLGDIEIICVDDGSSDRSGSILDSYAKKDSRIIVLHRENAGYGAAMNAGIDEASSEYIGIVESDDCIKPEMYEELFKSAISNDLDFVKSDAYYWFESFDYMKRVHSPHLETFYDKVLTDVDRNVFFDFFMNIWTGIYRKSFLMKNGIRFNETPGASYQDNSFWMQTMMYAKRVMWLNEAFYLYRQDNPLASVKSPDKVLAMTREYEFLENLLKTRGHEKLLPYCYYYKLFRHRGTFYRISDDNKLQFCAQIEKDYYKYKSYIHGNSYYDMWLHNICNAPDYITERIIETKNYCIERLNKASNIIVYGAGNRGDVVIRILYNEGFYDKVSCFAITNANEGQTFAGKNVLSIDDAVRNYKDSLIIIAVVRESYMYEQMRNKVQELGIANYIDGADIEKNFYIL